MFCCYLSWILSVSSTTTEAFALEPKARTRSQSHFFASGPTPVCSPTATNRMVNNLITSRGGGSVQGVHSPPSASALCMTNLADDTFGQQDDTNLTGENKNGNRGRTLLLLVAILYGTLNVSLRLVYNLPDPPSAAVLSATRGWLSTACFIPPLLFSKLKNKNQKQPEGTTGTTIESSPVSSSSRTRLWKAVIELAVWNLGAQGLLNIGLLSTGSARASFLTQMSVVLTPLISMATGQVITASVGIGCLLALLGLVLLCGGGAGGAGFAFALSSGDLLVLGAALCWSLYLFRLTQLAREFQNDELSLQAMKSIILAVLYSIWVGLSLWSSSSALLGSTTSLVALVGGWIQNPAAWLLLLYSAIGPGTVADVVQQLGQKQVSTASEANIILSLEPVFAAVFAFLIMGEATSLMETLGGGLILVAALVATK